MWLFKRRGKPATPPVVSSSDWKPRYYSIPPVIEAVTPGIIPPRLSWPDMDADACGHRTAESLMGLFSRNDPRCDTHLWCGEGDRMVIAECYQAHAVDNPLQYIGVYLWPVAGLAQDDSVQYKITATGDTQSGYQVTGATKPLSKALMWPLAGGDVLVQRGTIKAGTEDTSHWGQGNIDPDTIENIRCMSREVRVFLAAPSEYQHVPPAILAVRSEGAWHLGRCWQMGSLESGETVWQSSPRMCSVDCMYQPHTNDAGHDLLRL